MLTKTCNDLLPNHAKLYKEKQHSDDKCTLWCQNFRKKMNKLKTDQELKETLCIVIADWMENNKVEIIKFLEKYNDAMITQENIGWSHMIADIFLKNG